MAKYSPGGTGIVNNSGQSSRLATDSKNNLNVSVASPLSPFGEVLTTRLYPVDQTGFTAGVDNKKFDIYTGSGGSLLFSSSMMVLSSSDTMGSYSAVRTKKYVNYRAGQGTVGRFTAAFSSPESLFLQIAGLGHAEDGLFFGYDGADFGIQFRRFGALHIQKLEITTGSTTNETIPIVLDGVAYSSSVTNNNSIAETAFEIAISGNFTDQWAATATSGTVYFVPQVGAPAPRTGEFSVSGSTLSGTFSVARLGKAPTTTWIRQTDWNIDTLDGTGPSGMVLDPLKGNVYQIGLQYLGFGEITFDIENPDTGDFTRVHEIRYPNSDALYPGNTPVPSLQDPTLSFLASVASLGAAAKKDLKIGSYGLFAVGEEDVKAFTVADVNTITAIGDVGFTNVLSVRNGAVRNNLINRSSLQIVEISVAVEGNKPAEVLVYKDPVWNGNVKFVDYSDDPLNSVQVMKQKVGILSGQIIDATSLPKTGAASIDGEKITLVLERNETISVAVRATSATTEATVSINWYVVG
jgi:hypothetical protein